jgi:surface protein
LHFNTGNFRSIKSMFSGCYSLTSIDLSNFNTKYSHSYKYIFYDCPNLQYVNIEPFSYDLNDNDLFNKNISSNGTLLINREYYDRIKKNNYIPSNWKLIFPN